MTELNWETDEFISVLEGNTNNESIYLHAQQVTLSSFYMATTPAGAVKRLSSTMKKSDFQEYGSILLTKAQLRRVSYRQIALHLLATHVGDDWATRIVEGLNKPPVGNLKDHPHRFRVGRRVYIKKHCAQNGSEDAGGFYTTIKSITRTDGGIFAETSNGTFEGSLVFTRKDR